MANEDGNGTVRILLVEDNQADVRIIKEILKDFKTKIQLYTVKDGIDALHFLNKKEKYENVPGPDLILLDLNLPRKNGRELLSDLKTDANLKNIPVIILTTSNTEKDIINAYELQANCFITKPIEFNEYKKVLRNIEELWLKSPKSS